MALSLATVGAKITAAFLNLTIARVNRTGMTAIIPTSVTGTGVTLGANGVMTMASATSLTFLGGFTTEFDNYVAIFDATAGTAFSVSMTLAISGTANAVGYDQQYGYETGSGTTARTGAVVTNGAAFILNASAQIEQTIRLQLFAPALSTRRTKVEFAASDYSGSAAPIITSGWGGHRSLSGYDGANITWGGTIPVTGTFHLYGMNNN